MVDNKEAIERKLGSSNSYTRTTGWFEFWVNGFESRPSLKDKLKNFFWYKTGNPEDTEDLLQETYKKVLKRILDGPLSPAPERFVWEVARNLWNDMARRRARLIIESWELEQFDRLKYAHSPEVPMLERVEDQEEIKLTLRLPKEWDRELALLLHLGHTPQEIALLTGWDKQKVTNRVRSVKRQLEQMQEQPTKYLSRPSHWEQQFNIEGQHAFGVSHIDVFPQNIAPDCKNDLLKDFDVNSLDQLQQEYSVLLRLENINTEEPSEVLTFTPRTAFGSALLGQTPVNYQDYVACFDRDTGKGGWQDVIVLNKKEVEYPAHLNSIYYDDQDEKLMSKWNFPSLGICVHKYLSEKKISAILKPTRNPAKREEHIGLYQVYPLEGSGKQDGIIYV